jgi:hypothetical protein
LQGVAALPPPGADEAAAAAAFTPALSLASSCWRVLLEQLSHSTHGAVPKDGRAWLEDVASELASVLTAPEWPAAQLLLYMLANRLIDMLDGTPAARRASGRAEVAREDREGLLELAGVVVAKVRPQLSMHEPAAVCPSPACCMCACT